MDPSVVIGILGTLIAGLMGLLTAQQKAHQAASASSIPSKVYDMLCARLDSQEKRLERKDELLGGLTLAVDNQTQVIGGLSTVINAVMAGGKR